MTPHRALSQLASYNIEFASFASLRRSLAAMIERMSWKLAFRKSAFVWIHSGKLFSLNAAGDEFASPVEIPLAVLRRLTKAKFIVLTIPTDDLLISHIELPDEAIQALPSALEYSLSTWTPFDHNDAFAAAYPIGEVRPGVQSVELRLALKSKTDLALGSAERLGCAVDAIALGDRRYIVDLPASRKGRQFRRRRWLGAGLALLLSIQALVAIHLSADQHEGRAREWEAFFAAEARRGQERVRIQQEIASLSRPSAPLKAAPVAPALVALSELLGEAVIDELELQSGRGRMTVASRNPIDIVDLMAKSLSFKPVDVAKTNAPAADTHMYIVSFTYTVPKEAKP